MLDAAFGGGGGGGGGGAPPPPGGGNVHDIANAALEAAFGGGGGAPPPAASQSRILSLSNMVSNDDLADETEYKYLLEDVEAECKKFGALENIFIPRIGASGQGKVFLAYATARDAAAAFHALDGREFGPNRVAVTYYSEEAYGCGNLA